MLYPFIFKNKYKLKCSKEECIEIIKKQFIDSNQFKGRFYSWGFQLIKRSPKFELTITSKAIFVVRGNFIEENDSMLLVLQINMIHNLILLIIGVAFLVILLFSMKFNQVIEGILGFLIVMSLFIIVTLNQEKNFIKWFERVMPVKNKAQKLK